MAVLGSVHMFSDQYLDKEENAKVQVGSVCKIIIINDNLKFCLLIILPFAFGWLLVLMFRLACVSDTNCKRAVTPRTSIPNNSNTSRIVLG